MPAAPFSVWELSELKLPWVVRRRVRRLRGHAGIVLGAVTAPDSTRSGSFNSTAVSLSGNGIRLSLSTLNSHRAVAARLPAGPYRLAMEAARSPSSSLFEYGIELADGDVFVAVCRPIQRRTLFGANPESNDWHLGFAWAEHHARCVHGGHPSDIVETSSL
ncbi:hypothetical protein [Kutzneria sp. NPDC052558]|uniref:hypothetical protein n=1 Tax=Kutzneria sp. NPDC052558 TaxID=3364121 RepID=UPI0037C66CDB